MAYSEVSDLLTGDIPLGAGVDAQKYVDQAADDMDAKLGWIYEVPIDLDGDPLADPPVAPLPNHQILLLKGINNKLASGRLILTLDISGEDKSLHAYGHFLIKEANAELLLLANGTLDLSAPRVPQPDETTINRVPGVVNLDEESLLTPFVKTVHGGVPWYAVPGEARADG